MSARDLTPPRTLAQQRRQFWWVSRRCGTTPCPAAATDAKLRHSKSLRQL